MVAVRNAILALLVGLAVPAGAQEVSASHRQAALDLMEQTDVEGTMQTSIDEMLGQQIKASPEIAPFEDVLRDFMAEHLSFDAVRDDLVELYVEAFTEDELREIIAFNETPVGQKAIRMTPMIMVEAMRIGQQAVEENQDVLVRQIEARARQLAK